MLSLGRSVELCLRLSHRDFPFVAAFPPVHARTQAGTRTCLRWRFASAAMDCASGLQRTFLCGAATAHPDSRICMPRSGRLLLISPAAHGSSPRLDIVLLTFGEVDLTMSNRLARGSNFVIALP